MTDWALLAAHLRSCNGPVTLSWAELDQIVGGVPATAAKHRPWWSGNRPHVRSWRSAGYTIDGLRMGDEVTFVPSDAADGALSAGSSREQRDAELAMLTVLGSRLGLELEPARLTSPSGAYIDVDGVASDRSVLAECWAHQGSAKVAQKYKLVNDAAKLHWAATWLDPVPQRLLLCVSDEAAVKHLRGTSWQGQAIASMGVKIEVVSLPADVVTKILEAQKRQFR